MWRHTTSSSTTNSSHGTVWSVVLVISPSQDATKAACIGMLEMKNSSATHAGGTTQTTASSGLERKVATEQRALVTVAATKRDDATAPRGLASIRRQNSINRASEAHVLTKLGQRTLHVPASPSPEMEDIVRSGLAQPLIQMARQNTKPTLVRESM